MLQSALEVCIRCGSSRSTTDALCTACTWPFSLPAWDHTACRIKRITRDTCCINSKRQNQSLNQLEDWAERGYFLFQRTDEMLNEVSRSNTDRYLDKALTVDAVPGVFILGGSMLGGGDVLAGPDLTGEIRSILFPHPQLTKSQESDVRHLNEHVRTGGDIFTTLNTKDFLKHGKQEKLAQLGIWVFRPDELIQFLVNSMKWDLIGHPG